MKKQFFIDNILESMFGFEFPMLRSPSGRYNIKINTKYGAVTRIISDEIDITARINIARFQQGLEAILNKGRLFIKDFSGTITLDIVKENKKIIQLYAKIGHRIGVDNINQKS